MFVDVNNRGVGEVQAPADQASDKLGDKISLETAEEQRKTMLEAQKKLAAEQENKQKRMESAKDKAAEIKNILQIKLNHEKLPPDVAQHLENAIHSCNACINVSDSADAHIEMESHLGAARAHVHNAKERHPHKVPNDGVFTHSAEFVGCGDYLSHEHAVSH